MREPRFGIDDQPKYWVLSAIELETGKSKIIKMVFQEDFIVHVSILKIHCYRSPEKESKVLDLTREDRRFMQGYTTFDKDGNNVRIIDYIRGQSLFKYIPEIDKTHQEYFHEDLPGILYKLADCILAIELLHSHGLCHGDIRNDHIMIDRRDHSYRWIDFDLKQDISDFDTWSLGNVINYTVAKGIITFKKVLSDPKIPDAAKQSLNQEDGSAFYSYRIMNLQKVYPYIPERLSKILLHFVVRPRAYYRGISNLVDDYLTMLEKDFPKKDGIPQAR